MTKQVLDKQYTEKTYYLKKKVYDWGRRDTALQAELIAVDRMTQYLQNDKYETDKIMIYTDNQTVLQALDRLIIKIKVCASNLTYRNYVHTSETKTKQ